MRSPPRTRSATRAWSRPRWRSAAAARPAGSRSPRTRPRRARTPTRSSAWTSAASRSTTCGSSRPRTSPPSTTPRSSSTARRRSCWRCVSRMGGMDVEEVAESDPDALVRRHIEPGTGLTSEFAEQLAIDAGIDEDVTDQVAEMLVKLGDVVDGRGRDADRDQPADRHQRPPGRRPRLEGDDRRQRALPPPRARRADRQVRRGPAGGDGEGEGPHLRQARRQHRHPRQRRRALHVDARRRRPGRRQAGELPRRRRRLEGRGDRRRARGDHLRSRTSTRSSSTSSAASPAATRSPRGSSRPRSQIGIDDAARRPPRRHQLGGGPGAPRRGRASATSTTRRRCWAPPRSVVELAMGRGADDDHRRQGHEARRLAASPAARAPSTAFATATTAPTWSPA